MKSTAPVNRNSMLLMGFAIAMIVSSCAADSKSEEKSAAKNIGGTTADLYADAPPSANGYSIEQSMKDSVASSTNVYKPMATGKLNDTNHVFMRNADMRCSVKDVRKATFEIERIVRKYDGFVTYTSLNGTKTLYSSTQVSKDSLLNMFRLNIYNEIVLRVPNENLDSTLIEMNELIDFIDNRTIKADDVKLQLLALQLKSKRNNQHIHNLNTAVTSQGKKLTSTVDALNEINNTKASLDEQQLNLLELKDKVSYSTVKLYVYQPEVTEYSKALAPITVNPYTPSFSDRLASAGSSSMVIFQYLLLFFVIIWPVIVVVLMVWLIIRLAIRKRIFARIFKV